MIVFSWANGRRHREWVLGLCLISKNDFKYGLIDQSNQTHMRVYHTELDHLRRILFVCLIFESICETVTTLVNNNNRSSSTTTNDSTSKIKVSYKYLNEFICIHVSSI